MVRLTLRRVVTHSTVLGAIGVASPGRLRYRDAQHWAFGGYVMMGMSLEGGSDRGRASDGVVWGLFQEANYRIEIGLRGAKFFIRRCQRMLHLVRDDTGLAISQYSNIGLFANAKH